MESQLQMALTLVEVEMEQTLIGVQIVKMCPKKYKTAVKRSDNITAILVHQTLPRD